MHRSAELEPSAMPAGVASTPVLALCVLLALACGQTGVDRLETAVSRSGEPFELTYMPISEEPHELWFDVEVSSSGPYLITGTVSVEGGLSWPVSITPDGPPIGSGRVRSSYAYFEHEEKGVLYARGLIYGTQVPGGTGPQKISGTLTRARNTRGMVRVVVAEP